MDSSMEEDEAESTVRGENSLPENMALTENASYTHSSTKSACLDFFFEVMQMTQKEQIVETIKKSWDEDPHLSLKLIFQLRDIRSGKGAVIEFHHCLIWLFHNHPQTLLHNLEHVAKHGYWKDLSWLVKFLIEERVSKTAESRKIAKPSRMRTEQAEVNYSLEEIIKKRVDGVVDKSVWKRYLTKLPDDEAKKNAKLKFQELSKAIHLARKREAKIKKKSAGAIAAVKLLNFKTIHQNFSAVYDKVVDLFVCALVRDKEALEKDKSLPSTALAGKWAPGIGNSIDAVTSLGKNIARQLYSKTHQYDGKGSETDLDNKAFNYYRKEFLTPLRTSIKIPEQRMSSKKWTEIDYQRVPSVSMKRNKKNFLANDAEGFNKYLEDVKSGKKKIASGALLPHEIVQQFMERYPSLSEELMTVSELQWKSYVENLKKSGLFESCLSVCDVSGSMSGTPMEAAIALSLLTAELSKAPFSKYIVSFSSTPVLHLVDQPTLAERVAYVQRMDWGMSTNVQAVFDLILKLATQMKLPPTEMVKTLFIFSDMEFDQCGGRKYETDYQLVKRKFETAGYPLPAIIFWNLRGDGKRSKPVTKDEKNVALISGFSGQMLKTFLEGGEFESPFSAMLKTLGTNYDHLKVID